MNKSSDKTFMLYIKPLLIICSCSGIVYLSKSNSNYIYSIPFAVTHLTSTAFTLRYVSLLGPTITSIGFKTGGFMSILVAILSMLFKFPYYWSIRKDLKRVLGDISAMAISKFQRKSLGRFIVSVFAGFILVSGFDISVMAYLQPRMFSLAVYFFFAATMYMGIIESLLIVVLLSEFRSQYKCINSQLKMRLSVKKLTQSSVKPGFNNSKCSEEINKEMQYIHNLLSLHFNTGKVCKTVNELFALPIIATIGYQFMALASSSQYLAFWMYSLHAPNEIMFNHYFAISHVIWITSICLQLTYFIRAWTVVEQESSNTLTYVHEYINQLVLRNEIKNSLHINQLHLITIQLINKKLIFTTKGVFVLNYRLLQKIVTAVTTYVIILIQFDSHK